MKRNIGELNLVKEKISSLKGETVEMSINRGRKKNRQRQCDGQRCLSVSFYCSNRKCQTTASNIFVF